MRLEGKVAIITGGARGQGAAECKLFAQEGAKVVIGDVLDDEGSRLAAEIAESGGEAVFVHLDVTKEEDWRHAVELAISRYGKLNVLVNNAAIWRGGNVEEESMEQWDSIMDVNVRGIFIGTKLAVPEMRKAGGGSIVNISSTAGLHGDGKSTAYTTSKGAVRLLTKSVAAQYGREGIRANSIHPGFIDTEMSAATLGEGSREEVINRTVVGRVGTPEDVAYGALYLASDESTYVSRSELTIDGGATGH